MPVVTRNSTIYFRCWFIDGVIHASTQIADDFLMVGIVEDIFTISDVIAIFVKWSADKLPTEKTLENMMSNVLPALGRSQSKRVIYSHGLISFGAMVSSYEEKLQQEKYESVDNGERQQIQVKIDNCSRYFKVPPPCVAILVYFSMNRKLNNHNIKIHAANLYIF